MTKKLLNKLMHTETFILLKDAYTEAENPDEFLYSDKQKGAGYHRLGYPVHTVMIDLENFKGKIKIQGTLCQHPGDNDWVDIVYDIDRPIDDMYWFDSTIVDVPLTADNSTIEMTADNSTLVRVDEDGGDPSWEGTEDSALSSEFQTRTFIGNWVWLRVAYVVLQGAILQVRYTF